MTNFTAPCAARPRRWARMGWRVGWVLLVLISFCVTYVLLVVGGH